MKQILVPCDFSKEAIEAYKFAHSLASVTKLGITVIHAIDLPKMVTGFDVQSYTYEPSLAIDLKEVAFQNFNAMKQAHGGSAVVLFDVVFDNPTHAIKKLIEKENIELIIMGTKGTHGIDEMLFGSNTEKIVRISTVPVIAVRLACPITSIKEIVFPNKLTLDQKELMSRVMDLQTFFDANLKVLWVNTPSNFVPHAEINGLMKEFAHYYKLNNYSLEIRNDLDEATGILGYSHELKADMIAMGTSSRRGLAHLLAGSIAEDVVNHSIECPIWTFSTRK
jgi:nucleotide-binding universal stress UspA family protein